MGRGTEVTVTGSAVGWAGRGQEKIRLLEELRGIKANLVKTESFFSLRDKESFCAGVMEDPCKAIRFSQVLAFEKGEKWNAFRTMQS